MKKLMRGSLGFALIASALLIGWMTVPGAAEANHGFDNEYWNSCGPYGCIGWKQWAVTPYSSLGTAHMDNGGTYCGTSLDTSWANAIVYWNGASTAASFTFPRSDCTPVSFPSVRVVPYSTYNSGVSWWGTVYNYDRDPSSGTWYTCWYGCNRGESGTYSAQYGYDLSEVYFNTYYSPSPGWEWVARHEIGHVVGLDDHHLNPYGCNSSYYGLMDDAGCDTNQLTANEKSGVNHVNGR